jgi:hypothetical protein
VNKTSVIWILSIIITLSSVIYQRLTGPTRPVRGSINIGDENIEYKLLRTHETTADAIMTIITPNKNIAGEISWKRYKSYDTLLTEPLPKSGDSLIITIPKQPMAGKVIYQVSLVEGNGIKYALTDEPIIIRFKDPVPIFILIPHVIFMFGGMLLSTRTGFEALFNRKNIYRLTLLTAITIFIGGLILGPIVQKYAFDAYWTGWPFGHDLTDNKTFVALIFWLVALWRVRKNRDERKWVIIASAVTLIIFIIPHSVMGSEIDYTKIE